VSRTRVFASAKVFFFKDQFVNLPANPHSEPFHEHHAKHNTISRHSVNKIFSLFFWHCQARSMPCVNKRMLTHTQANPMPSKFPPCNAQLRQSQQVPENAGKHAKSGFLLRLRNTISKFT
jgi:hypothetical protein